MTPRTVAPPLDQLLATADAVARARPVVAGLCEDLVAADPGAAVRARSRAVAEDPGDLHDPQGAAAAYLVAPAVLQL